MKKINECKALEEVELYVKLFEVHIRKTNTGADYATMFAFDGVDKIEAKMWNFTPELREKLESGEVYYVKGRMKEYQGKLQLNVNVIRKVDENDDVDINNFYETAKISDEVLKEKINEYYSKINNDILKQVVGLLLNKHLKSFFEYPAAVKMHHNYYYGLAYHTYSMLRLSDKFIEMYPFLNKDLIYAGIIVHDIGKVIELSGPKGTTYTKIGKLIGHISIGANEVHACASDIGAENSEEIINLIHIVLSHHGKLEFGSPKTPITAEAEVVHLVDYCDSRMASLEKELNNIGEGEFTDPIFAFDRTCFYVPKIEK